MQAPRLDLTTCMNLPARTWDFGKMRYAKAREAAMRIQFDAH
jgi:hypothetical protein